MTREFEHLDAARQISAVRTLAELFKAASATAQALDYQYFSIVQANHQTKQLNGMAHTNYPDAWVRHSLRNLNYLNSPVIALTTRATLPFDWADLGSLMTLLPGQQTYMREIRELGLRSGLTVPIHLPGEPGVMVSFVSEQSTTPSVETLAWARYLADLLVDRARAIRASHRIVSLPADDTTAQLVKMIFRGRSLRYMAEKLDLPQSEIARRIQDTKAAFPVGSDLELIARTLYSKPGSAKASVK